jgi:hypothetical protein
MINKYDLILTIVPAILFGSMAINYFMNLPHNIGIMLGAGVSAMIIITTLFSDSNFS